MTARFISLEGGDGAGKTTQLERLALALEARGQRVVRTREPGGSAGGERIRALLLDPDSIPWSPRADALLFAAARADHVETVIRPALSRGDWVLSDRFVDSSRAYQGGGNALGDATIVALHRFGSEGLMPDRTFLLDLPEDSAVTRATARDAGKGDRIGDRPTAFHAATVAAFRAIAAAEPERVRRIDASGSADAIHAAILADLEASGWI